MTFMNRRRLAYHGFPPSTSRGLENMTFKRALAIALTVAAALPASAAAQAQITPTDGDNYLSPIALSDFSHPAPFPKTEIGFVADTTNYTTQADLFNPPSAGGPPEPTACPAAYG